MHARYYRPPNLAIHVHDRCSRKKVIGFGAENSV